MKFFLLSCLFFGLAACTSSKVVTVYKTDRPLRQAYNRIIVIAITSNETLRAQVEQEFVNQLGVLGYTSSSSVEFFGVGGLAGLGEEGTYLKFCDEGVDAILTVVPVREQDLLSPRISDPLSLNAYFYNRIWQYPRIRVDSPGKQSNWETVLFDLVTLSPQFAGYIKGNTRANSLANRFVLSMKAGGVLINLDEHSIKPRPF